MTREPANARDRPRARSVLAVGALLVACAGRPAPPARSATPTPDPAAVLQLAGWCEGGEPVGLAVELALPLTGIPAFRLNDVVYGTPGMAALISAEQMHDDAGPLPLTRKLADGVLELKATRPAVGTLRLRYRARSLATSAAGGRYGLRHDATGIGGSGMFFVPLPDSPARYPLRVQWRETPGCATGWRGMNSAVAEAKLSALHMTSFFLGAPQLHAHDEGPLHVRAAWFGQPAFDTNAASAWAARAFAAERAFFADADPTPYHVFVRVLPALGERSQGIGQPASFLAAIGPRTPFAARLKINIAHEMLHRWIGLRLRFAGPDGTHFWFTEGFTVHYAAELLRRAGLVDADEFLAEINGVATRHFANPRIAATNAEIARDFFSDDALSVVPYTRGALYAAELDAAIRRASSGQRSLDDLMRALLRELPPGGELQVAAFRAAVVRELGAAGGDRLDAVIFAGAPPDPPADAYGPCFTRTPRTLASFDLGLDERRSRDDGAIRGLRAGSAAQRAGLVEGDTLVALESTFLFPDKQATVTIDRGGEDVVIRYLPAGEPRDGFAWARVTTDPRCR